MNINEYLNQIAMENEKITEETYKSLGFNSVKLDYIPLYREIRCPDYHFSKGTRNILCEVKTLHSAYYDRNLGHISMTMPQGKEKSGIFKIQKEPAVRKIRDALTDSVDQRRALCKKTPEFSDYPFLVAMFFDFFADDFLSISGFISDFPEISAVIKAYKGCRLRAEFSKFSVEEMELILDGKKDVDLPDMDVDYHWHVVLNQNAAIPFSSEILGICEFDQYLSP